MEGTQAVGVGEYNDNDDEDGPGGRFDDDKEDKRGRN